MSASMDQLPAEDWQALCMDELNRRKNLGRKLEEAQEEIHQLKKQIAAAPTTAVQGVRSPWNAENPCPWCKSCGQPAQYHIEGSYAIGAHGKPCRIFVPWEGPAAPIGGDTREALAKHIRKTRFFNEDQEARSPKWEDLPKDFRDIFYGEADKILSLIHPQQDQTREALNAFLSFGRPREGSDRYHKAWDDLNALAQPQHPGEAK